MDRVPIATTVCERIEELDEEHLYSSNDPSNANTDRQMKIDSPSKSSPLPVIDVQEAKPEKNEFLKKNHPKTAKPKSRDGQVRSAPVTVRPQVHIWVPNTEKGELSSTIVKQTPATKHFNDSIIESEKGSGSESKYDYLSRPLSSREHKTLVPGVPGLKDDHAHRVPKRSLEMPAKPSAMENQPKSNLFSFNLGPPRMFRKKSHEILIEPADGNKTLLSLRDHKKPEPEDGYMSSDNRPQTTFARIQRNNLRNNFQTRHQTPSSIFHSMISNKRFNFLVDLKLGEKTDRRVSFSKKTSGQIDIIDDVGVKAGEKNERGSSRKHRYSQKKVIRKI